MREPGIVCRIVSRGKDVDKHWDACNKVRTSVSKSTIDTPKQHFLVHTINHHHYETFIVDHECIRILFREYLLVCIEITRYIYIYVYIANIYLEKDYRT